MSNKLLDIEPLELQFHFELKKQISCTQYLINKSDDYVAFKAKITNPKNYCVMPRIGVVPPRSYIEIQVTMQAQKEVPADMKCNDKFLFQCFVATPGTNAREVTSKMFNKDAGNQPEETKLRVVFVDHPPRVSYSDDRAARELFTRLTEEKNSAVQLNKKLQEELDQLKPERNKSERGCGILINIKRYFTTLRRKTVKKRRSGIQS